MDDETKYLMREINKNISIGNRIYGSLANKLSKNSLEGAILYSLLIFKNVTQNDIVNEYSLPKQTVNNFIKKFEEENLVILKRDKLDKRKKTISLTEKGILYINQNLGPILKKENEAAKLLGISKLNAILNSLKELNSALDKAFNKEDL